MTVTVRRECGRRAIESDAQCYAGVNLTAAAVQNLTMPVTDPCASKVGNDLSMLCIESRVVDPEPGNDCNSVRADSFADWLCGKKMMNSVKTSSGSQHSDDLNYYYNSISGIVYATSA